MRIGRVCRCARAIRKLGRVFAVLLGWAGTAPAVVINEISYNPPEGKEFEFIELHNPGAAAVAVGGWAFTRGIRFEFPAQAEIPAGGYLVVCRNPEALAPRFGLGVEDLHGWYVGGLDNGGENLVLVDAAGAVVDALRYDDQLPWDQNADGGGPSLERLCVDFDSDNPANWVAAVGRDPSPLASNGSGQCPPPPLPLPTVAINEIYYHPLGDRDADHEYVELTNATEEPIQLRGYCFSQGIEFCFGDDRLLQPGEILLVCRNLEAFRGDFGIENAVGDFVGQLSNDGERLTLVDDLGRLVDSVRYSDGREWPIGADGFGSSLEKIVPGAVSDDPASWSDSGTVERTGWRSAAASGQGTSSRLLLYNDGAGELLLDNIRLVDIADPDTNLLANGTFDEGIDGWTAAGNHADSGWRVDGGPDGSGALHLNAEGRGTSSNSVNTQTVVDLDRSGATTYSLSFDYRPITGSSGLTARLSISTPSRGIFVQLGRGPAFSAGEANRVRSESLPPYISHIHRFPREPTSEDAVWVSARVRGDGVTEVSLLLNLGAEPQEIPMRDDGLSGDGLAGDGVYGAQVPPQPHNSAVTFRIEATSAGGTRASPLSTDPSELHGYYVNDNRPDSPLPVFHLILPPQMGTNARAAISRLSCASYSMVSFAYRGDLYHNVGLRRRGQSVCGDPDVIKKFLKVRFQRGHFFEGLRKINLQSLWTDKSLVRERMAWDQFGDIGSPYCFHYFVRLHANGAYFGLYAAMEHPDKRFLARNNLHPEGNLYKAVASREERAGTRGSVQASYEKKTNEDGDFSDLSAFLNALHDTPRDGLVDFFRDTVDEDSVIDYQAAQVLTNNRDYPHKNHYLYHDTERGKWMPITWDMDLTYGKRWDGNFEGVLNDLMDNPGITPWYTTNVRGGGQGNHFLDKFFSQAGTWYRRAYLVRLWDALHEKYTIEFFDEKIDTFRDLIWDEQLEDIAAWGRSRPSANDRNAPAEFDPNLARVRQHIAIRRQYLLNYLQSTERFSGHDRLKITEIMYNPIGDDAGEFLELWNNSGKEIDISGWTIEGLGAVSDEGSRSEFRFPGDTAVADGEVFIVAKDPVAFSIRHSITARVFGPYPGSLANEGEYLRVKDAGPEFPATVDFVRYGTEAPWPARPDGLGFTLELTEVHPDRDNDLPRYWRSSLIRGGSPGRIHAAGSELAYFSRGNCDGNGNITVTDAVRLLRYLFRGADEPSCLDACDANGNQALAIDDAIALLEYLFVPGAFSIPAPGPGECAPARNGFCEASNCEPAGA